jgi:acyl dehydratase
VNAPPRHFEDFQAGETRLSRPYLMTEAEIVEFGRKYDPQPFHTDPEAARHTFYGTLIASGWLTCAVAMRLICELYVADSVSMGSPGIDEVRWLAPVKPGDTLRLRWTVVETKPSRSRPQMGAVRSRWEMLNQEDEVVMHMTGWGLFGRRDVPEGSSS